MCSKAFSNPECYGYHPIWIGNTDEPDSVRRIQRDIDSVGWLAAGFKVIRLKKLPRLNGRPPSGQAAGIPFQEPQGRFGERAGNVGKDGRARPDPAAPMVRDQPGLHRPARDGHRIEGDGIIPDDPRYSFYECVMRLDELRSEGLLAEGFQDSDPAFVGLLDQVSGFVVPAASGSMVQIFFYDSGMTSTLYVMDGVCARTLMERYPRYFTEEQLDDNAVETDIAYCESILDEIMDRSINLRNDSAPFMVSTEVK